MDYAKFSNDEIATGLPRAFEGLSDTDSPTQPCSRQSVPDLTIPMSTDQSVTVVDTQENSTEPTSCSVADCLARVFNEVSIPSGVKVTKRIPENLPEVVAVRKELLFVFRNIVRSACEAMCEGGELKLSVVAETLEKVIVSVQDTGEQIGAEHYARITGPLFSGESRSIGLVLALSSNVLQRNFGSLEVKRGCNGNQYLVELRTVARKEK